ncbi:MAG: hypothetical protein AAF678_03760 [Pseudomonadota bacterium]
MLRILILALIVCTLAPGLRADILPYSGAKVAETIAIFHVEDKGIRLELEVMPRNMSAFLTETTEGQPAIFSNKQGPAPELAAAALNGITISTEDGSTVAPRMLLMEPRERVDRASAFAGQTDPLTGTIVPSPPDDPSVIFIEAVFDFDGGRPDRLVLSNTATQERSPLDIGFLVFDRAVPVTRFSFLETARLDIDWTDPWGTAFTNTNLNRPTQDGTTSYLYVTPREIRHEILMRLPDLATWIETPFPAGYKLNATSQTQVLEKALEVFANRNPVSIEGEAARPGAVRGTLLSLSESGFQVEEGREKLLSDTTFVGAILSYPITTLPSEASVTWDMFDERIDEVPMTLTDQAGAFIDWATPDRRKVTWTNYLRQYVDPQVEPVLLSGLLTVPVMTVGATLIALLLSGLACFGKRGPVRYGLLIAAVTCLGVGYANRDALLLHAVSPKESRTDGQILDAALSDLLAQVYVAALEITPSDRAAALAPIATIAGHQELAKEMEASLSIRVPGGGSARVTDIGAVAVETRDLPLSGAYEGLARWQVQARAGHWGHDHRRRIEYRARVTMVPESGRWKFAALTVLEARSPDA